MQKEENLIKYYLLERGYNTEDYKGDISELEYINQKYEKYLEGEIVIQDTAFEIWLKQKIRNNYDFGCFLKENGLLVPNDNVIEITASSRISCTSLSNLPLQTTLVHSTLGESTLKKQVEIPTIDTKIVSTGLYTDAESYMLEGFKSKNPIVMGFIGYSKTPYNKRQLEYYKTLRSQLQKLCGDRITEVEGHNIYLFHYDCPNVKTIKLPNYTVRPSDR